MGLIDSFNYYYYDMADARMKDRFLLESIWSPILVVAIYMLVIFKIVPDYMKNRPAYKLNTFIKCYNVFQVVTNAYVVRELSSCYPFLRAFDCRPATYPMDACAIRIMNASYITMLLKIVDLIETAVFLLRKKNNQVTVLHMYHHISTVLIGMIFPRYLSIEIAILFPILNCFVHVIMYSYYFLSNFEGPIKQMITPYKRYLTMVQMGQFVIFILQLLFHLPERCEGPTIGILVMLVNVIFNFGLFYNFYRRTYLLPKQKKN